MGKKSLEYDGFHITKSLKKNSSNLRVFSANIYPNLMAFFIGKSFFRGKIPKILMDFL